MNTNTQIRFLKIGNIVAVIATIIVNILANSLPLNGKFTGELSDSYPNLFVPAGITFAIWGIIYVLLIIFALYQIKDFSKQTTKSPGFLEKIGMLFIIGSIGNIAWIFFWHYEQVLLSLGAMILLFASLLGIYLRLDIGNPKSSRQEFLFVHIPFSVYLGLISVATIANITALLVDINWQGFRVSQGIWTVLILAVVILLTCLMLLKRKDIAYSLVIIWALTGIALKRMENDPVFGIRQDISNTAIIGIIIISVVIIYTLYYYLKKGKLYLHNIIG